MLNPGTKLGPYEVAAPLGAGGMGEVYRSHDSKLNRDVALKVLPAAMANDADRMARFQREAQVLASLNHPNIASIYGLEESGGVRALVMELVDGPTLAERIAVGAGLAPPFDKGTPRGAAASSPLQLDEALQIAKQIAEALEYAHERSVIHRDLKPANVKITHEGVVKVLDFGLAKAIATEASGTNLANSPTISIAATQAGVILGTAAYMSPEQAKGKSVDRRTDIWAFGCVLYEMLTGKKTFEGETVSDVLAAVIMRDPDWSAVPELTPASICKLLRRCLEKDSRRRLRDIGEARITIEETLSGADVAPGFSPASAELNVGTTSTWRRALPWAVAAGFFLVAAIVSTVAYFRLASAPARSFQAYIARESGNPSAGWTGGQPELSPDGTRLVFPANGRLWVRGLDSLTAQPLAGTEGPLWVGGAFWSPDSSHVGFFADGKLKVVDLLGSPPVSVCDAPNGRGGTWSSDGVIVLAADAFGGLSEVPAAGGTPTPVTQLDKSRGQTTQRWPVFLPDRVHFVYWADDPSSEDPLTDQTGGIYLGSLKGGDQRFLFHAISDAEYSRPGYLLFLRGDTLMAQPFDASQLMLNGEALPLVPKVANPQAFRLGMFSVSRNDVLVYETPPPPVPSQVLWLDAQGKQLGNVGQPGLIGNIRLSPDGGRLAEVIQDSGGGAPSIWIVDLARGASTQFTVDPGGADSPVWAPDGSRIAFASPADPNSPLEIDAKSSSGVGSRERLYKSDLQKKSTDWSRDGRFIAFNVIGATGTKPPDIWVLPLSGDPKPAPFLEAKFGEADAVFSPDGKWLAYRSDESGGQVYIVPFPKPTNKWQVSTNNGEAPRWRGDGKELFYVGADNKMTAVDIREQGVALEIGKPRELFQLKPEDSDYDVTADGKKFLIVRPTRQQTNPPLTLVTNWPALLKEKK